jgi:hypothetical protein
VSKCFGAAVGNWCCWPQHSSRWQQNRLGLREVRAFLHARCCTLARGDGRSPSLRSGFRPAAQTTLETPQLRTSHVDRLLLVRFLRPIPNRRRDFVRRHGRGFPPQHILGVAFLELSQRLLPNIFLDWHTIFPRTAVKAVAAQSDTAPAQLVEAAIRRIACWRSAIGARRSTPNQRVARLSR